MLSVPDANLNTASQTISDAPLVSLVFPIYNEEAVLPHLLPRLDAVVNDLSAQNDNAAIEAIFVNDGSRDNSLALLAELSETRPWMRVLGYRAISDIKLRSRRGCTTPRAGRSF